MNAELLRGLIDELVGCGKYIVMSSHQMNTVEEYCENILILHHGKTMLQGDLREIKKGYGHTDLVIKTDENFTDGALNSEVIAKECNLILHDKTADEYHYKIKGDHQANDFLNALLKNGIYPIKYEIKEPSLNDIFIEKVGGAL